MRTILIMISLALAGCSQRQNDVKLPMRVIHKLATEDGSRCWLDIGLSQYNNDYITTNLDATYCAYQIGQEIK